LTTVGKSLSDTSTDSSCATRDYCHARWRLVGGGSNEGNNQKNTYNKFHYALSCTITNQQSLMLSIGAAPIDSTQINRMTIDVSKTVEWSLMQSLLLRFELARALFISFAHVRPQVQRQQQ
jgi:hypothetical protein